MTVCISHNSRVLQTDRQIDRQTDGPTDIFLIASPRRHSMLRRHTQQAILRLVAPMARSGGATPGCARSNDLAGRSAAVANDLARRSPPLDLRVTAVKSTLSQFIANIQCELAIDSMHHVVIYGVN